MHVRRSILGAAAGAAALAALPVRATGQGVPSVLTMQFAMKGLQPVTTCFIGDKGPYIMLIDTGDAVGFLLKQEIIDKLNLRQTGVGRLYGASGTDTAAAYLAHDVIFGQAVRQPEVAFIASAHTGGLDGILPLSLFTARPTEIDFATGQVRVHVSGAPDRAGYRAVRCERVRTDGGAYIASLLVDGLPARLVVDTGAETTVSLNPQFVQRHGLWARHPKYAEHPFRGVTGAQALARQVRSPQLKLGDYLFKDVIVSLSDPSFTTAAETDGLLGIEILRRFTLGLDPGGSSIWLKPNDALSDPYPYDHAGMRLKFDAGSALVEQVSPMSPAEQAGFKVGDRLREVDTPEKLGRLEGRLYLGPLDTPLTLAVVRDGQRMPIKLTPQDWL